MRKCKYYFVTFVFLVIAALSLNTATSENVSANIGGSYKTIDYKCPRGQTIDRCWYGSGGCCISCKELCKGGIK